MDSRVTDGRTDRLSTQTERKPCFNIFSSFSPNQHHHQNKIVLFRRSHLWCLNTFSTQRSFLFDSCVFVSRRKKVSNDISCLLHIHSCSWCVCVHERLHLSAYFSCLVSPSLTLLPPLKLCLPQLCSETDPHRAKCEEAAFTRAVQQQHIILSLLMLIIQTGKGLGRKDYCSGGKEERERERVRRRTEEV